MATKKEQIEFVRKIYPAGPGCIAPAECIRFS